MRCVHQARNIGVYEVGVRRFPAGLFLLMHQQLFLSARLYLAGLKDCSANCAPSVSELWLSRRSGIQAPLTNYTQQQRRRRADVGCNSVIPTA